MHNSELFGRTLRVNTSRHGPHGGVPKNRAGEMLLRCFCLSVYLCAYIHMFTYLNIICCSSPVSAAGHAARGVWYIKCFVHISPLSVDAEP